MKTHFLIWKNTRNRGGNNQERSWKWEDNGGGTEPEDAGQAAGGARGARLGENPRLQRAEARGEPRLCTRAWAWSLVGSGQMADL